MDIIEKAFDQLSACISGTKKTATQTIIKPENDAFAPKEADVVLFSKLLRTKFKKTNDGKYWFAELGILDGSNAQTYLLLLNNDRTAVEQPVKVFPINPSPKELLGYEDKLDESCFSSLDIAIDKEHAGEIIVITPHMKRVFESYKEKGYFTEEEASEFLLEITDWTKRTSAIREAAVMHKRMSVASKRKPYMYTTRECDKCKRVVISERAYISMLAEAISRDPLETGGVLLGHYDSNGTWYVVEATDPGLDTYHSTVHNEMDDKYYNHLYPVLSRIYKRDLNLVGLWHRHPNSFDRFSNDDNKTNKAFAEAIGNGTLSFLINFDPGERLTCYYLDETGTGEYHSLPVYVGDKHFKHTDYLELNTPRHLWKEQKRLNEEILTERNGG